MKNLFTRLALLIFALLWCSVAGSAQTGSSPVPVVKTPVYFDVSPPLRVMPIVSPASEDRQAEREDEAQERLYPFAATALPQGPDPVWQQQMGTVPGNKAPLLNFDGNPNGWFPPDCNGEAGPNYYFQTINVSFQIYDKTGTSVYGPTEENTIWAGMPGSSGQGVDPVILYDQQADRWFFCDFTSEAPHYVRVAVSQTNDPTGSWYRWVYYYGSNDPDYAKYGVWRDGYYFSANLGGGLDVGVLDRSAMLAGNSTATFIQFSNPWRPNSGFHCILPFDNDGAWAASGTSGQFVTINDDAWGGSDQLWLYTMTANWATPSASTFSRTQQLDVAPFDANFGAWRVNIYQKGTSQRVDAIPLVLMHKAQYRNFGSYQSLVCCHSVDVDNTDHAGIRWYELRRTTGGWYVYQQGTYAPDADSRWCGSISQNQYKDIAVGYSVSSTNTYPSIRYTGRRNGDTPGVMTIAEQNIWAGAYSQTGADRWGDYSGMSIDPTDDKTFWFTTQYIGAGQVRRTRVAAFSFGTGCTASGGCDEYISRVQAGSIDNTSACLNYADYTSTQSTNLPVNGIIHATVTNGNGYTADQCGIWVDWNRNGSFSDAGEQITVTGNPGVGPYTATIVPPAGQTMGNCTMRVRITYTGTVDPCGVTPYGEVEDYTINVSAKAPNYWTGNFNNYWGNAPNWSLEHVPTADEDVIIPNVNMPCIIDYTAKACNNLTLYSGGTLLVSGNTLTINGDMHIYGQLAMDNSVGVLNVMGSAYWESGSTANITASAVMWIYGWWEFKSGANVQLTNGFVDFAGSTDSYINSYADNCSFYNVGIYKTSGYELGLSYYSTTDLAINGYLAIQPNATFGGYSTHSLILRGPFYNNNHFICNYGTFVFDGVNQSIRPGVGDYFHNLTISPTGTTSFDNSYTTTLTVQGNLVIDSGVFDPLNNTVEVTGNWSNNAGPSAFAEGSGKVVFNGSAHQYCTTETFYNLEVNKSAGAFRVNGGNVICNNYDWTAGAVDVLSGTFTANSLADNGIAGNWYLNTGGTINLYNMAGWVDLKGYLNIYGGNFNVYGGNGSDSYWPYNGNGGIVMTNGILDFKNVGVYVYNNASYTFSESITGGTIRTARGFAANSSDYTPDGGTIEFYGPTDASFYSANGGYVRNVIINKAVADNSSPVAYSFIRDHETSGMKDAPLSNTINIIANTDIKGSVTIQSGLLTAGVYTTNVEGNWNNLAGSAGFDAGTSTVVFDGAMDADILSSETFYNMSLNKTYAYYDALELMSNVTCLNDLHILDGSLEMNYPSNLNISGNLTIDLNAGLNANDMYGVQIFLGKNWTNANTDYSTEFGFDPGNYSTVTFNGTTDQYLSTAAPQEYFNNLVINKSAGSFRPNANIMCLGDGLVSSGTWNDNVNGLTHTMWNNFTVAASGVLANASQMNTFVFAGVNNALLTYSGSAGYFHHLTINKTTGYSVTQVGNTSCQFGGNLTIDNGLYDLNGYSLLVNGDVTVNDAGTLFLPVTSSLVLCDTRTLNVNTGGKLDIEGTTGGPVTVRANVPAARYTLNVNSGGTIAADYCTFKNMSAGGVNVKSGSTIDLAHSFTGCTFQDGTLGGTLLTIDNSQIRTIRNAVFPANTWGGSSNVTKTVNAGYVYFVDYSGTWSGEANDNDTWNRIQWVPTLLSTPAATPAAICPGATAQLNANPSGGISPYTYAWSPSGSLSDPSVVNPMAYPAVTTAYSVTVTDALGTAIVRNVTLTVNPILPAGVTIAASSNPVPPGTFVTFTATPVNGGSTPSYQWKVNGVNVGSGLPTYSYIPSYNDQVTCVLTSNYSCVTGNPATSNVIIMIVVAANATVNGTVPSPLSLCFDASNTITVAGGGNTFLVQNGGSARFIAGVQISFLPTTTVEPGGYMHAYITSTNAYCGTLPPSLVSTVTAGEQEQPSLAVSPKFNIYPNPTTGRFTLEQKGEKQYGKLKIEIYGMRGEKLLNAAMTGEKSHEFSLSEMPDGLYFVKVVAEDYAETLKLVIAR